MTTKVKPAVPASDIKQHLNSTTPSPKSEAFPAKPSLEADDGISSEEEEDEEEENEDDEEEEQEAIGESVRSRRTSSASVTSQSSEKGKEKVTVAKDETTKVVESEKESTKKVEEKDIADNKPIKKEPVNHSLINGQVKLEKIPIVKVKKEPSTREDEDEKNESSGNDSGVESGSGDSTTNSTSDTKNIPPPKIGSLTILGPSLLKSSMKNGAVSITPANALTSPLNALSVLTESTNSESTTGSFVDAPLSNEYVPLEKLALMGTTMRRSSVGGVEKCDVCGEQATDAQALEAHRVAHKHFKCGVAVECAALLFEARQHLVMHKLNCHALQPTPPASPLDQMSTPQNNQLYCGPVPNAVTSPKPQPQPGSIQPRSFASLAAPPSQQNSDLLNSVNTNQLMVMKRLQSQPPSDAPSAKGRKMDVSLDNGIQMQGGVSPVQLRPGSSVSITAAPQKGSANSVANLLATRGITVTPSDANRSQPQQAAIAPQTSPSRPPVPAPLTLSSAISILPASNQSRQGGASFASPQGRSSRQLPPPTLNLPTVDLTKETPQQRQQQQQHHAPQMARGRPPRPRQFTCQVCDKGFHTRDALTMHMSSHSSPGKLSYRCNLCNAQYPTQQGLAQHKQTFHKESSSGSEMALPVVDLRQPGVPERLAGLGIRHCIPLSQLQSQAGGLFGVPIIAIDSARSPAQANLGGLGASNILSLGPLKSLNNRL